ncbi:MAG: 30S ribosomal protein S7 [Bacteroidales bacterium]|nr:30S ribosomal protein S7 [Bacteroidales bacterium]
MRKIKAKKRFLLPDPKFKDVLVTRFINTLMQRGKKNLSSKVFYDAIKIVETKIGENGLEVWRKALANITPAVEVRSRRIGGATFQIPQEIRPDRRISMAIKWLISYARERSEKSMGEKLAAEIMAAYKEEGASFKKKEDTHRMAEANKAFSHFRF